MKPNIPMSFQSLKTRECFIYGALNGAAAWLIYGIAEYQFYSVFPWLIKPAYTYQPSHWGFSSLLMLFIYPVTGIITAGLLALLLRLTANTTSFLNKTEQHVIFPVIAVLTIILVFSLNLVHISLTGNTLSIQDRPVMLTQLLSLFMVIMLLISTRHQRGYQNFRLILNPWTASFILIGVMWVNKELLHSYSLPVKLILIIMYVILVFSFSYVIQKTLKGGLIYKSNVSPVPSRIKILALVLTVFAFIGLSSAFKQTPLITPRYQSQGYADLSSPNVILIVMDTVRADHLSLYGYERDTSPNLNKFAENATLYTQAIAPGNMTLTSHASMFTGYSVRQHGAHDQFPGKGHAQPLDSEFETLAEILSGKGYSTLAIVSNMSYLCPGYGLNQGFEYYDNRSRVNFLRGAYPYVIRQEVRNLLTYIFHPSTYDLVFRRAETINNHVFSLLEKKTKRNRPLFMFINYMDAHRPYMPPPPFDNFFPGKNDDFVSNRYFFAMKKEIMTFKREINEAERNHLISQYDGGIAYMDFHIGKLLEKLKDLDLYENSIIIITSDHGESFGERNLLEHGMSVYQGVIHVPLIIKSSGSDEGKVVNEPVSLVDMMPLVLEKLGYKTPAGMRSTGLNSFSTDPSGYIISESYPSKYYTNLHENYRNIETALYSGKYKFISSTAGKRELFDLSVDADEKTNLYSKGSSISGMMEISLNNWVSSVEKFSGPSVKIDKDSLERLKSLGYIQ